MKIKNSLIYSLLLVLLYTFVMVMFYPSVMPLLFLSATFVVATVSILSGFRIGVFVYFFISLLLWLSPTVESVGLQETWIRFIGFTATSLFLGGLNAKLRLYEEEARTSEKRLQIVSDSLSDVLITIDKFSIITFTNPAVEKVFGWKPEELVGKPLTLLMPERLKEPHLKGFERYLSANKKTLNWKSVETTGLGKDGVEIPIEISFGEFFEGDSRYFSAIIRDISLRKEYDKRMSQFAAIVEFSDDAIVGKDLYGNVTSWNKGAEVLFQYKEEEILGKNIRILLPEGREQEEELILTKIRSGKAISHYETTRKKKDGTLVPVSLTVSPIKDEKGEVTGASKIVRDISYRIQSERHLLISQERYKAFMENSEEAIWLVEYNNPIDISASEEEQINKFYTEGVIVEANKRVEELYGTKVEDMLGKNISIVTPRTKEGEVFLRKFISSGYNIQNWESESLVDGKLKYASTTFKGIIENGKMTRGWVSQRETTEKRTQERSLLQSEERYKAFIEKSENAIWRVEFTSPIPIDLPIEEQINRFFEQGRIAEANGATAVMLKVNSKKDLFDKYLQETSMRTSGDDRFLRLFIENGYTLQNYESSDGTIHNSSSMTGIIENNNWVRAWVVRRDVTEEKSILAERERLLEETQRAKQALEVASAEKDRFLANLSHELRTPLVAILGYSAMLLETEPSSEAANKMITTINKNAKLQVQLIEDLLDLSRIISGKIELKKSFFDVNDLCRDAVETMNKQATDKGLSIEENYDPCIFYGDRKRLAQVILNLLSNAVKFTERGKVYLSVRCSDTFLTITVTDSGIGIDPKNFDVLFQPFKQLDSSSTRAKAGLGLGLSIVKNIVDLHSGKVTVESKIGEGSQFSVYLPVVQVPSEEHKDEVSSIPNVDFSGVKILLVEDDPDSAGFVKYLYEQKNAKVDWVNSAKKAREYIEKEKYDLYIFDLSMPEEDGMSLIRSIRGAGDETKAVALTAFADAYYEKAALQNGFNMFLKKPSSLLELLSVIKLIK